MFIPRTRNIYPRTPTFTPRTPTFTPRAPTVMRDCIYTIRCETGAMNRPLRLRNVCCYCLCTINVYSTCTQYLSQHHAADCPRTPTFTPRTRNIYPRTPTFTPRTPTVMRDCIYTIRCGYFFVSFVLFFICAIVSVHS
ncbi:Uncharacterised protein [uncultured Prevotella sp.]|nr:Uncharacterised protein [uncultured Prevotella sp.]